MHKGQRLRKMFQNMGGEKSRNDRNEKREQQEMKANVCVFVWREERIAKARMDKSRPSANK